MMQCAMISWTWKATSILMRYERFVFSVVGAPCACTVRQMNGRKHRSGKFCGFLL
jgi:hypothetical protein